MTRTRIFLFLLLLVGVVCIVVFMPHSALAPSGLPTRHITIATSTLTVEVASTETEREQGLSGRVSLKEGTGMLFVFTTPGNYGFWMKDMQIPLDIIFIDAAQHVIQVDSNLFPQTYPEVFYPPSPALYVLEVPAGFATTHHIIQGSSFVLQ